MREENELFSILLSRERLNAVYSSIGDTILNDNDIAGYGFNSRALKNSILLLRETELIEKHDGIYEKNPLVTEPLDDCLIDKIFNNFKKEIFERLNEKQRFDIEKKISYIDKNTVPLKYAGLMMLLEEYGEIISEGNRWLIIGERVKKTLVASAGGRKVSLQELEKRLLREKELGEEAEQFVIEYEKQRLMRYGIKKMPIQISEVDVTAGFDILSYGQSETEEIYIEVKSVDNKNLFHFSENEIVISKKMGKHYWLYLVNRISKDILRINNPYEYFFINDSDEWIMKPDGYMIRKL